MADTITKRIHVGGLVPNITVEHLRDRFRSFGTVLAVEEMGLNALGGTPSVQANHRRPAPVRVPHAADDAGAVPEVCVLARRITTRS